MDKETLEELIANFKFELNQCIKRQVNMPLENIEIYLNKIEKAMEEN